MDYTEQCISIVPKNLLQQNKGLIPLETLFRRVHCEKCRGRGKDRKTISHEILLDPIVKEFWESLKEK